MFHDRMTTLLIVAVVLVSLGFVISPTMAFAEKPNICPCKFTSEKIVRNSYKFDTWDFQSHGYFLPPYPNELTETKLLNCDEDGVRYAVEIETVEVQDGDLINYQCVVQSIDGTVLVNFLESIPADEYSQAKRFPDWYETCRDELKDAINDLYDLWGPPGESCE